MYSFLSELAIVDLGGGEEGLLLLSFYFVVCLFVVKILYSVYFFQRLTSLNSKLNGDMTSASMEK